MSVGDGGVTLIGLDDRAGWEGATVAHGLPSQTWSYAWGLAANGATPQLAVVRAGGAEMLLPFLERRFRRHTDIATLPGLSGALLRPDNDAPLAFWAGFARARGWVSGYIQLAVANETLVVPPPDQVRNHNAHFIFDATRWNLATSVGANMRRTLKAGDRAGAQLVQDRERLAAVFLSLHQRSMSRAGASLEFGARTLERWFADSEAVAFGAEISGRIEAAHLGRSRGGWAELHLAGASDAGRALQAWLIRQAVEVLGERGVRFVDIGGYGTAGDGLHQMKRRLGAMEHPMRSLRQIYDRGAFAALCAEVGADPNETYFPPYRARTSDRGVGE